MDNENIVTTDKIVQDFKIVLADAEELLRATASEAGGKVSAARERVEESLRRAKMKLADAEDAVVFKAKQTARAADEYVHDNPWRAVGIAGAVGLVLGLLIGRR